MQSEGGCTPCHPSPRCETYESAVGTALAAGTSNPTALCPTGTSMQHPRCTSCKPGYILQIVSGHVVRAFRISSCSKVFNALHVASPLHFHVFFLAQSTGQCLAPCLGSEKGMPESCCAALATPNVQTGSCQTCSASDPTCLSCQPGFYLVSEGIGRV